MVRQKYEVQVRDAYVLAGNTGVLRCEIPAFVKEYVAVTSWFQDSSFNFYPTAESGECNYASHVGEYESEISPRGPDYKHFPDDSDLSYLSWKIGAQRGNLLSRGLLFKIFELVKRTYWIRRNALVL